MKKLICLFAIIIFIQNFINADLTDGLVAHYPFNGNADDESGNGLDGIVTGATLTTDRFSNTDSAYYFDGINDFIEYGDHFDPGTNSWCINYWIRTIQTSRFDSDKREGSANPNQYGIIIVGNHPSQYEQHFRIGMEILDWDFTFYDNAWHNICLMRDVNNAKLKAYADGNFIDEISITIENIHNAASFRLGCSHLNTNFFEGKFDDIRFYNRVLTEDEIETIYHQDGWDSEIDGLVAYYPFNNNADDESGNEHHGTVYGAIIGEDRFGNSNAAYEFDGTDDFIDCGLDPDLNITTHLSVSCWVKYYDYNYGSLYHPDFISNADYALSTHTQDWKGYLVGTTRNHPSPQFNGTMKFTVLKPYENYGLRTDDRYDDDKWHHVVSVFYPGHYLRLYVDGEIVEQDTVTISSFTASDLPLSIGRGYENDEYHYFDGLIDDIRIYNRILSEEEVSDFYHENDWMLAPDVTIEIIGNNVELNWTYIVGANSYRVYSSENPYEIMENWILEEEVTEDNDWSEPVNGSKFYIVRGVQ